MNVRLETRLLAHSIDAATLSAGKPRKGKRGNGDIWLWCAVLLVLALVAAHG